MFSSAGDIAEGTQHNTEPTASIPFGELQGGRRVCNAANNFLSRQDTIDKVIADFLFQGFELPVVKLPSNISRFELTAPAFEQIHVAPFLS